MPELPEVETVARTLSPCLVGRSLVRIEVLNPGTWQGALSAQELCARGPLPLAGTGRRGKVLLIFLNTRCFRTREKGCAARNCLNREKIPPCGGWLFTSRCPVVCLSILRTQRRKNTPALSCIWTMAVWCFLMTHANSATHGR